MLTRCNAASVTSAVSGSHSESEEFTGVLLLNETKQHTSAELLTCLYAQTLSQQPVLHAAALAFFRIVGPTALALLLCNMDRICMSVAILPMAKEFGWPPGVQVRHTHCSSAQ